VRECESTAERSEIVPENVCLQAVGASPSSLLGASVTACLLKNVPASLRVLPRLTRVGSRSESESEQGDIVAAQDPKRSDLAMGRLKRGKDFVEDRTHQG